jgi:integrative and conjugative element protein (TIGR02256 family)
MNKFRQLASTSSEGGGMLLGRVLIDSGHSIVDVATEPLPNDRRGRFFFLRKRSGAQKLVDEHWLRSGGTCNYLGEWHTHPERFPQPSCKDIRNWLKIVKKARYSDPSLFFVIVGIDEIGVWQVTRADKKIVQLARNP